MGYSFKEVEDKWLPQWANEIHTKKQSSKEKYYCLDMFPYPSAEGLHVGHWRGYVLSDVIARKKWLEGYEILHPMGWDAFGLPAENYALKKKIHPSISTEKNVSLIRNQIKKIGAIYNWSNEINTTDSSYYKWTQWIFLQMFKAGLAYQEYTDMHWCPACKTGLANEEVVGGLCDRCGQKTEKKKIRQWILKITHYAEQLLDGLQTLNWPEKVKVMQKNWIGKSVGVEVSFKTNSNIDLLVFTTRPETIYGVTFLAISIESPLLEKLFSDEESKKKFFDKLSSTKNQSHEENSIGIFTGESVIHPFTREEIPIFAASYVVSDYGTGVVMGVPAHHENDYFFAVNHNISIRSVIQDPSGDNQSPYIGDGILMNSGEFDGLSANTAGRDAIVKALVQKRIGTKKINYRMRDWIFSRQRYWGEPIPLVHCKKCGVVPLPEDQLPLILPYVESYQPSGNGESPLDTINEWITTSCPSCGDQAKRETNTMPQWAGSCWYFLRYPDHKNTIQFCDKELLKKWLPVDKYVGGVEHAILHLLYARFYIKFLKERGFVQFDEPFINLFNQGMIVRRSEKSGLVEKMSKSKGNAINPDEYLIKYGSDTLRLYILFLGNPELSCEWQDGGIEGCARFLRRLWEYMTTDTASHPLDEKKVGAEKVIHKFLRIFNERIDSLSFNTAISAAMECLNTLIDKKFTISNKLKIMFLTAFSTMAPSFCAELLEITCGVSILDCEWPEYNEELSLDEIVTIAIQINGKLRCCITVDKCASKNLVETMAKNAAKNWIDESFVEKIIYIPGKLINFVVRNTQ